MKFLFVSNFYPPASRGGYEQWCQEVAEGLRKNGHSVYILTSTYGLSQLNAPETEWIYRRLYLELEIASLKNAFQFFTHRRKRERENLSRVRNLLDTVQPDAVLIWGMWNLQHSIPALIEKCMENRVAYYMGDYWPLLPGPFVGYWDAPARTILNGIPKMLLKPVAKTILAGEMRPSLRFEHVLFPSKFMLNEFAKKQVKIRNAQVVYGAVDTQMYLQGSQKEMSKKDIISMLFVGRLSREKGVHTAIQAVGYLVRSYEIQNIRLIIVGDGETEYEVFLQSLVAKEGIEKFVQIMPAQPKESLPSLYRNVDLFLFTSIWAEPFGRVLVEAMASGVPVIGAQVGGAAEVLMENENALIFPPENPLILADQIKRLVESPELRKRLAESARRTAINRFDINRMTEEIGAYLTSIAKI